MQCLIHGGENAFFPRGRPAGARAVFFFGGFAVKNPLALVKGLFGLGLQAIQS